MLVHKAAEHELTGATADSVTWNEAQFGAMLQKYIAGRLLRTYTDAIIGYNSAGGWVYFEFFGSKFENSREWSTLWNAQTKFTKWCKTK